MSNNLFVVYVTSSYKVQEHTYIPRTPFNFSITRGYLLWRKPQVCASSTNRHSTKPRPPALTLRPPPPHEPRKRCLVNASSAILPSLENLSVLRKLLLSQSYQNNVPFACNARSQVCYDRQMTSNRESNNASRGLCFSKTETE